MTLDDVGSLVAQLGERVVTAATREVVHDGDAVTLGQQPAAQVHADESGAAQDEGSHAPTASGTVRSLAGAR